MKQISHNQREMQSRKFELIPWSSYTLQISGKELLTKIIVLKMSVNGFLAVSIHAGLSLCIFNIMHNAQSSAYMDEIFHIPQARKYCYGKFDEVRLIMYLSHAIIYTVFIFLSFLNYSYRMYNTIFLTFSGTTR